MHPRLSVVIPVYDNWWLTARALRVVDRLHGGPTPFETIVVDNASSDETPQAIGAFERVRYLRMERNVNFAGACNAGARLAQAPLVLFLNNDAFPLDDAFSPLVGAFDDERVAIAGGALFFEDGVTQSAGLVVLPNAHWHYSCRNLPPGLDGVTRAREATGVSGAAMAVRASWFERAGGFDESYVNGFEDVDLCMRARSEEQRIAYVAGARFAHYEGASAGRFDREAENERRFYRRWSPHFSSIPRVARGDTGAIAVHAPPDLSPLEAAALADVEGGLRSFGHPVVHGPVRAWQLADRRFRHGASLGWFAAAPAPGVTIDGQAGRLALARVSGAVEAEVAWLPCAAAERSAACALQPSAQLECATVLLAGVASLSQESAAALFAEIDALIALRDDLRLLTIAEEAGSDAVIRRYGERAGSVSLLRGASQAPQPVACALVAGLTDRAAFGNVVLARAALPAAIVPDRTLRQLFPSDVAPSVRPGEVAERLQGFLTDPAARARCGALIAAEAHRRFTPRRTAIRIVDLLCAARFGYERPARARSNAPLRL
jgi:GT2 family glycosyltransferase